MKRVYIAMGVLVALVIITLALPARFFSLWLRDYGLHLLEPSGTIWSGSGNIVASQTYLGRLSWDVQGLKLLSATLVYDVEMNSPLIHFSGSIAHGLRGSVIKAEATIDPDLVNQILIRYDIEVNGHFNIDNVEVGLQEIREIQSLSGTVNWEGGTTRYQLASQSYEVELPPMTAQLTHLNGDLVLDSVEFGGEREQLMTLRLEPDTGWIHISLSNRMLEIAEMPWDSAESSAIESLEVSRQVFSGQ